MTKKRTILNALNEASPINIVDLHELVEPETGQTKQQLGKMIDALRAKGLVERGEHHTWQITDAGQTWLTLDSAAPTKRPEPKSTASKPRASSNKVKPKPAEETVIKKTTTPGPTELPAAIAHQTISKSVNSHDVKYPNFENKSLIKKAFDVIKRNVTGQGFDPINRPLHYNQHPSGIEPIEITEHENFCIGNAIKYLMRHRYKGETLQDLQKARYYIDREINRLEQAK